MNVSDILKEWNFKTKNRQAAVEWWNSMAGDFGERPIPSFERDEFLQLLEIKQMLNENSDVLDVGCGAGGHAISIASKAKNVMGLDLSPQMIESANRRAAELHIENARFNIADWHEFDIEKEGFVKKFDLVYAHMTPAIQSYETFQKFSDCSRGWCVMVKPVKRSAVVFWTFGNLGSAGWIELLILAAVFLAAMVYFLLNRWNYNAMESGADTAKSLGVNTRAVMLINMGICSLAAAVAVSFVGIISFVGLVAPHMMRRFVGNDYRYLIPCSAVAGALLLILADTFGRLIIAPRLFFRSGPSRRFWALLCSFSFCSGGSRAMVEVNNISFTYNRTAQNILEDICFDMQQNQCIAILGNNGAGKSTLLKCIDRICPAQKGVVLVDGKDVFRMTKNVMAQNIAYVQQNNESINMTVFDAILLGRKPYIKWDA